MQLTAPADCAAHTTVLLDGTPTHVWASPSDASLAAYEATLDRWPAADTAHLPAGTPVVVFGGDGFVLRACHAAAGTGTLVFGVNCGHVGFLSNSAPAPDKLAEHLPDRVAGAHIQQLSPLEVTVDHPGGHDTALAFNDTSLLRATSQAAHLHVRVSLPGCQLLEIDPLIGDGLLVSMPAGSTGYARSAGGSVLPLDADAVQLVALAAYSPQWRGAVLPSAAQVNVTVASPQRRRVLCSVDHREFCDVAAISARVAPERSVRLGFDPGHELDVRVLATQFPPQPN